MDYFRDLLIEKRQEEIITGVVDREEPRLEEVKEIIMV